MQVSQSNRPRLESSRLTPAQRTSGANSSSPRTRGVSTSTWQSHPGFGLRQAQFNVEVTSAQRALEYLASAAANMQAFKSALSASIAGRHATDEELAELLAQARDHWQMRWQLTGGCLDLSLAFHPMGDARQPFRIDGLALDAMQLKAPESITLWPEGLDRPALNLWLDGRWRAPTEWARRLDHTLAPAGIEVSLDSDNQLSMTVGEQRWPRLEQCLLVQGSGVRFPGDAAIRPRLQAASSLHDPSRWNVDDSDARRNALRDVVRTLTDIAACQSNVQTRLDDIHTQLVTDAGSSIDTNERAMAFVRAAQQGGPFRILETVMSATRGLQEHRVRAVAA